MHKLDTDYIDWKRIRAYIESAIKSNGKVELNLKERESILKRKITPLVEKEGFKVFDLRIFYSKGKLFLRVLIDFEEGGISLEDCALMNRKLSIYLDKEPILDESFTLEVSSPGVQRALLTLKDFLRVKNKLICLWLKKEFKGKTYYEAKVLGIDKDSDSILLEIEDRAFSIPLINIRKARQKIV